MLHQGQIVVDVKGKAKEKLTVPELMEMFQKNSGSQLDDDKLLLTK